MVILLFSVRNNYYDFPSIGPRPSDSETAGTPARRVGRTRKPHRINYIRLQVSGKNAKCGKKIIIVTITHGTRENRYT